MMVLCDHFGQLIHKIYLIYHRITNDKENGPNESQIDPGSSQSLNNEQITHTNNQRDLPKMSAMVRQMKEQHSQMVEMRSSEQSSHLSFHYNLDEYKDLFATSMSEMQNIQHLLEFLNKKASSRAKSQNSVSAIRQNTEQFNNLMSNIEDSS